MATIAPQFGEPLAGEETFVQPQETLTERRMAQLFFICFWTIIFTGSVRKWVFPGTSAFYVLQDIPITIAYIYAIQKGFFLRGVVFLGVLLISAVVTLQALMQIILIGLGPFMAVVGLHHYLYYLPMLLVFPIALTPKYRRTFIRCNIWAAPPMVLLSLAQAMSPTTAWVNRTSEGNAMALPGVDIARISGPFNFGMYYGIWIGMAFALCLGEWLSPRERRATRSNLLLIFATCGWALIALISGSRQNILNCALAAGGAFLVVVFTRSVRGIAVVALGLFALPLTAALVYAISPAEMSLIYERFTATKTNSAYDMKGRIGEQIYGWVYEPDFSLTGKGIGLGVDAAHFGSIDAYNFTYSLSETDDVRNVMELGTPVGYLWCLMRFGLAIGMVIVGWRVISVSPHCLPLACILLGQVASDLTRFATMTFTQVMIGYAFILSVLIYPSFYEPPQEMLPEPVPNYASPA